MFVIIIAVKNPVKKSVKKSRVAFALDYRSGESSQKQLLRKHLDAVTVKAAESSRKQP